MAISPSGIQSSGVTADVAEAGPDRSRLAFRDLSGAQLLGVHAREHPDHEGEARGIEREAGLDADGRDQDPGEGRTDHPGAVHKDAVQADRVDDAIGTNHLHDERLPGRIVDGVDAAAEEDQPEDHCGNEDALCRQGEHRQRRDHVE